MKFSKIQTYLSAPRINRYLDATGNKAKAIRLYKANLKIAQAFHPILGVTEVVLKNKINTILSSHFSDPNWIINQKSGFMSAASLQYVYKKTGAIKTNDYLKQEVQKAERRIKKSGTKITSGKIIAEQSLGFWSSLFEVHHYKLLSGQPIKTFENLPPSYGRKEILTDLNFIRRFRNRINHNEPICFTNNTINFDESENAHKSLKELLCWIDPQLLKWITDLDCIQTQIINAKKI